MKNLLSFILFLFACSQVQSQAILRYPADTVKFFNADTTKGNELQIGNRTRNRTGGFLKNIGNGKTIFDYSLDSNSIRKNGDTLFVKRSAGWDTTIIKDSSRFIRNIVKEADSVRLNFIRSNSYFDDGGPATLYNTERAGNTVYALLDNNTSAGVTFDKVTVWHDGSAIDDTKVDGIIYRKKGLEYFKRNYEGSINVKWFGAKGDGVTDDRNAVDAALAAVPQYGSLFFPAGIYYNMHLVVNRSNINIYGEGTQTVLKAKAGGIPENVIEVGDIPLGNDANEYSNVTIHDISIDGNRANNDPSTEDDIHGWGLLTCKFSHSKFYNITIKDCWTAGGGNEINSNYNTWSNIYIENCGNFNIVDGSPISSAGYPCFDINSSKWCSYSNIITYGGYVGFRILDNCFGNKIELIAKNASSTGLVMYNQLVNQGNHANTITAVVDGGCADQAITVGPKNYDNTINATISNVAFTGLNELDSTFADNNILYVAHSNTYNVVVKNVGGSGVKIGGHNGTWNVNITNAGTSGAIGDYFAVEVLGDDNYITANLNDDAHKSRGLIFRNATTKNNQITAWSARGLLTEFQDNGTKNSFLNNSIGDEIPSANVIDVPTRGTLFKITGTQAISDISNAAGNKGRMIVLVFKDSVLITDSFHIKLNGRITTYPGYVLPLISDSANWVKVSMFTTQPLADSSEYAATTKWIKQHHYVGQEVDPLSVHLSGDQTVSGIKTFTSAITGLVGDAVVAERLKADNGTLRFRPYVNSTLGAIIDANNLSETALTPLTFIGSRINLWGDSVNVQSLEGTGTEMVVVNAGGKLSRQAIPSSGGSESDPLSVHLTGNQTIDGVKTFIQQIVGSVADGSAAIKLNATTGMMGFRPYVNQHLGAYIYSNDPTEATLKNLSLYGDTVRLIGNNSYVESLDDATGVAKMVTTTNGVLGYQTIPSGSGSSYTFSKSVVNTSGDVTLVNDEESPGNWKYYGTDAEGAKGFYSFPERASFTLTVSSSYTVDSGVRVVYSNYSGGTATITLPSASASTGQEITVKNLTTNNVTITPVSSNDTNTLLSYGAITYKSNGTTWYAISKY